MRIPLKELQFHCTELGQAFPITFAGFLTSWNGPGYECGGYSYRFRYDEDDGVYTGSQTNQHVPISCSTLCDVDEGPLKGVESWTVINSQKVQVNRRVPESEGTGWFVDFYPLDALYIEGDGYIPDDD